MTDTETGITDAERLENLVTLAEDHGVGCPRAVQLGGPGVVDNWVEEQFTRIKEVGEDRAFGDAEAAAPEDVEDEVAAEVSTVRSAQAEGPVESWEVKDPWEQLVVDHDEQISGLKVALEEQAGQIQGLRDRMATQESQGVDQWSAIEANTAGRIPSHQKANPPKAKTTPGKPRRSRVRGEKA